MNYFHNKRTPKCYSAKTYYFLICRVTDSLGLSSDSAPLTVSVTDVNDNMPKFSEDVYTVSVLEHIPQGMDCFLGRISQIIYD